MSTDRLALKLLLAAAIVLAACDRGEPSVAPQSPPASAEAPADGVPADGEAADDDSRPDTIAEPTADPVVFPGLDDSEDGPEPGAAAPAPTADDPARVQAVIRGAQPEVIGCYQRALGSAPEAGGRLMLSFQIDTDGSVDQVTVADTDLPDEVRDCVAAVIGALTFPPPTDGSIWVELPYVFAATGQD